MAKENASQRIERIKKEKNVIDVIRDIHRYAICNDTIDTEDIDRFKCYGLYTQNKNLQASDDDTQYYMLRVKLAQGALNIEQLKVVAGISSEFARDTANITTRQDLQFHFIRVVDLPEIFYRLNSVGLSTIFAAGDVPRNVVTCPVSGVEHSEIYDTREIVSEVNRYFDANRSLANLPRKYKVGISGCSKHCMGHEIQDLSFSAQKFENGQILFAVNVGGGLASNKQFAQEIGFVTPEEILEVVKVISIIYRDYGLRENRKKSRLGHLIDKWGLEKFKYEVEKSLGFKLLNIKTQTYTPYRKREHFGIHKSKKDSKSYIGCAINGGCIGAKKLNYLAQALPIYGATTLKMTSTQNFVILDVDTKDVQEFVNSLALQGIDANPNPFKARTLSCTGINFCKFALVETKDRAIALSEHLHKVFPDFDETISISLNGCPNSCAHPSIVDIGLVGTKFKNDRGETISGFEIILGGNLEGNKSKFGEKMKLKISQEEVNATVESIISEYIKSSKKYLHLFLDDLVNGEEFTVYELKKVI